MPDEFGTYTPSHAGSSISIRRRFIYSSAVLFFVLAVCEVSLRLFWHNSYCGEASYVQPLRIHPANRHYLIDRSQICPIDPSVALRTDSRSYLLPSFRHQSPAATIAFLGGSTTECAPVSEKLRFPSLIAELFSKEGVEIDTLNAARSGNTVDDSLNVLLNHVVDDDPDIVVMMHAINDVGVLARRGKYDIRVARPIGWADFGTWMKNRISCGLYVVGIGRKAIANTRNSALQVGISDLNDKKHVTADHQKVIPLEPYRTRLTAFVDICRAFGIVPVLMTQPMTGIANHLSPKWGDLAAQRRFNDVIREVGATKHTTVIDLAKYLEEHVPEWDAPMNLFFDGVHFTDKGSVTSARYIAKQLGPCVQNASADSYKSPSSRTISD